MASKSIAQHSVTAQATQRGRACDDIGHVRVQIFQEVQDTSCEPKSVVISIKHPFVPAAIHCLHRNSKSAKVREAIHCLYQNSKSTLKTKSRNHSLPVLEHEVNHETKSSVLPALEPKVSSNTGNYSHCLQGKSASNSTRTHLEPALQPKSATAPDTMC